LISKILSLAVKKIMSRFLEEGAIVGEYPRVPPLAY
jgi:hypothetical protein